MYTYSFEAFGTKWNIMTDDEPLSGSLKKNILSKTTTFENQFSRFKKNSQAVQFRNAKPGTYTLSSTFAELLHPHQELKELTKGSFDPAVGGLLEQAGYDAEYSFKQKDSLTSYELPSWNLDGIKITLSGPIVFDVGGIGKGFWIDKVAALLEKSGYKYYLVDGGRDIYATTKRNGEGWNIALEYPGNPELFVGTVTLKNKALAASDTLQRKWGAWNHLVDISKKSPQNTLLGCVAIADSALRADQTTSAISLCNKEIYSKVVETFHAQYLIYTTDSKVVISSNWNGELFNK